MEVARRQTVIHLQDPSHVGQARRASVNIAEALNLGEKKLSASAIVATELATNIIKHAGEGVILAQEIRNGERRGLQLLAIDKGPGIRDVPAALADGWTTAGTLGGGFGAMRRLTDLFDLYSPVGAGTCVVCELWEGGKDPSTHAGISLGIISTPYPGEELNGDGWTVNKSGERVVFMVVDGLGHGVLASEAAREAERIVLAKCSDSPATLLQDCHDGLAQTRGAAMAIAALDSRAGVLRYAGTGNIAGSIWTSESGRGLASHNGTLGHVMERIQEFTYPWETDSLLALHSDGISGRWNLNNYPGIRTKHPSLIAAVIYRDFGRRRDDSTVLIAQNRAA
jgi:anti-sigma regulatory factor (Ser/Thr protein kinase)